MVDQFSSRLIREKKKKKVDYFFFSSSHLLFRCCLRGHQSQHFLTTCTHTHTGSVGNYYYGGYQRQPSVSRLQKNRIQLYEILIFLSWESFSFNLMAFLSRFPRACYSLLIRAQCQSKNIFYAMMDLFRNPNFTFSLSLSYSMLNVLCMNMNRTTPFSACKKKKKKKGGGRQGDYVFFVQLLLWLWRKPVRPLFS